MFRGNGRWYRLTVLALGNLVLWVAIAAIACLLVSDQVDLGFETQFREAQATAAAVWRGVLAGEPAPPGRATSLSSRLRSTPTPHALGQRQPVSGEASSEMVPPPGSNPATREAAAGGAGQESAVAETLGSSASSSLPGPRPTPTASSDGTFAQSPGEGSVPGAGQGAAQSGSRPLPAPTPALLTQPLLLANPEFHNLQGLNAEMARSASGRVVQIRYQEAMLSQEMHTLCESNPELFVRNVRADLRQNQLVLSGEITFLGRQVKVRVFGNVIVRDCRPVIEIQTIAVDGIVIPQVVRDQIEQQVMEAASWYPVDYPLCLEQIILEDTRATVYGYRR